MHDIFISYSHKDREWVAKLATLLEAQGYSVWWDRELLPSQDYASMIELALNSSKYIITVWSPESVKSRWVRAESSRGFDQDNLIPILIKDARIPIPFDSVHTADLRSWNGNTNDAAFIELLDALKWRNSSQQALMSGLQSKSSSLTAHQASGKSRKWLLILGGVIIAAIGAGLFIAFSPFNNSEPSQPTAGNNSVNSPALTSCQLPNAKESIVQAAGRGHMERVEECIKLGVDVNLKNADQWTALHAASFKGNLDIIKLLIANGAEIEAEANRRRTALYLAVMANQYDVVHYLKRNGAALDKADETGALPFSRASTDQMKKLLTE